MRDLAAAVMFSLVVAVPSPALAGEYVDLVSSFEDDSDKVDYFLDEGGDKSYSTERASDGKRSLKVAATPGKGFMLGSLYGTTMAFDWQEFEAFKMDVYTAVGGSVNAKIKSGAWATDPTAKRFRKRFDVGAGRWTTLAITLAEMGGNYHPDGVVYLQLTPSFGGDLFIDNIRLTSSRKPAPVVKYLRQTFTGDASKAVTVAWQSREESGEIRYSPAGGGAKKAVKATSKRLFRSGFGVMHEATATGLRPGTEYSYEVRLGSGDWVKGGTFRTAPVSDDAKVVFLAGADTKDGRKTMMQISKQFAGPGVAAAERPRFFIYAGDAPQFGGIRAHWERWFQAIEPFSRNAPIMPSTGNHEMGGDMKLEKYADFNALPTSSGSELYYSFDYGPVHIISLETELGNWDKQIQWLAKDLAACRKPWKVALCHSPFFSSGTVHGSDRAARERLAPLFDKHHMDLVFGGDDHIYERSKPINVSRSPNAPVGSYREGTCYIISAGAGADLYNARAGNWWTEKLKTKVNHVCRVTVNGRRSMRIEAINMRGSKLDDFTIEK